MNHSGIGKINEEGEVILPKDVLSPLSISKNSRVWGMYYPCSCGIYEDSLKKVKYDFMISPIPYDQWGKVVRIKVRLKHLKDAQKKLTQEILNKNGSILLSESSRSAHNYDTWTLIITFHDLPENDEISRDGIYLGTKKKADELIETLSRNCEHIIFKEKCDEDPRDIIRVSSYRAMSYFYDLAKNKSTKQCDCKNEYGAFDVFELKCTASGRLVSGDYKFKRILENICNKNKISDQSFHVFCELDTNDVNIRMALIPNNEHGKYFSVTASYKSLGPTSNVTGFINYILSSFPDDYTVWRIANSSRRSGNGYDEGVSEYFIKDNIAKPTIERKKELKAKIVKEKLPDHLSEISSVSVNVSSLKSIYRKAGFKEIKELDEYDVFISYSSENKEAATKIYTEIVALNYKCYLSKEKLKGGDNFPDEIRTALRGARELVILISDDSLGSDWVIQEYGAAWILGKKVVPIMYELSKEKLPSWLKTTQAYAYHDLSKYLDDLQERDP